MNGNFGFENMKIIHFEELASTNDFMRDMVSDSKEIADTVVVASHQTAGKGMGKNRWESEPKKNLLFSIALNVNFLKAEDQFKISQAVSIAILNVIDKHIGEAVTLAKPSHQPQAVTSIKWPNDIYINSRKLAGMLIQNTLSGMMMDTTIIGIGLNVNQIHFHQNVPNPISLKMATGKDFDLDLLLNELIINIKDSVEQLRTDFGKEMIDMAYKKHLFRFGEWAEYEHDGEIKTMIINGYDKYGRLCLSDKNDHKIICDIKEIKFIL